ncbi:MAG: hypothetical protein EHM81_11770 [Chloroflexi bacterium]|nr:MAG: hypothetical protein EHM81_11770 [Chloroflexota bacterium]
MGFLKKLFGGLAAKPEKRYFIFQVKCKRCGEIIAGRVDLDNDLSVEYESDGDVYHVRKVLMGTGGKYCYQQVEVGLKFNKDRKLLETQVSGGEFVEND